MHWHTDLNMYIVCPQYNSGYNYHQQDVISDHTNAADRTEKDIRDCVSTYTSMLAHVRACTWPGCTEDPDFTQNGTYALSACSEWMRT